VHTGRTNALVEEALRAGRIAELRGFTALRREVTTGDSRLDFVLEFGDGNLCYVEVKNVTLTEAMPIGGCRRAIFPDSVTTRGQKHLRELMRLATAGHRAVMLYCVNRDDCDEFGPADDVDPEYGKLLRQAAARGVEVLSYAASVSPKQVTVCRSIPSVL
jgi:sugar fermentation stimulation protein A